MGASKRVRVVRVVPRGGGGRKVVGHFILQPLDFQGFEGFKMEFWRSQGFTML